MLVRRSIALADLASLLAYLPAGATNGAIRKAVVDENVLAKATLQARENALRQLVHYYGVADGDPSFAILRQLWRDYSTERPVCALLLASSRDRVLAATTTFIAAMPIDTTVDYEALADAAVEAGASYSKTSLHKVAESAVASTTMAGLTGGFPPRRREFTPGLVGVAYAAWLAAQAGAAGARIFTAAPFTWLGLDSNAAERLCAEASRRFLLEMKSAGGIVDITFHRFGEIARGTS